MRQMYDVNWYETPPIKKTAFIVAAVVLGHLGSLWAISLMKAPKPSLIKTDPILVHFVQLQTPPKPVPKAEMAKVEPKTEPKVEPKPEPIKKSVVKPEPIKPIQKVEHIQAVKQADTPKQVHVQAPAPVVEKAQNNPPAIETPPVIEMKAVESKAPVQQQVAPVQTSPIVKSVEIGGNGVQWRREPRISIDESELRGGARMVLVMIEANEKGEITSVKVMESSGIASLDAKVIRAVRSAKLKPYMENGLAYSVKAKQPFQFN